MNNDKDSFIRWQNIRITQLGYVNNLLILLSSGIFAFQFQLSFNEISLNVTGRPIFFVSMFFIFASILVGCYLAYHRLKSFRLTARIARKRERGDTKVSINILRNKTKRWDEYTYGYLYLQLFSFTSGIFLLFLFILL